MTTQLQIPSLRPVEGRRAFEEILQQLEEAIVAGHLVAGDRLPSEREFATQFRVSRTSVREALRVLEALGIISVRRGSENGATLLKEPGNALNSLLRFQLALQHISVGNVVEFRQVIESWAAGVLARDRPPEVVGELKALLAPMADEDTEPLQFHELDASFHLRSVAACGNELATLTLEGSRSAIQRIMLDAIATADDWPVLRKRLTGEHAGILRAIEEGDPELASRLAREHIRAFYDEFLGRPQPS